MNEFMKNWNWTKLEWHKKKIGKKEIDIWEEKFDNRRINK